MIYNGFIINLLLLLPQTKHFHHLTVSRRKLNVIINNNESVADKNNI